MLRRDLQPSWDQVSHAGLVLACYIERADEKGEGKREVLKRSIEAANRAKDLYTLAFNRKHYDARASEQFMSVQGRLVVGLGGESVLETGLTLHHTYGTPVIPGTALKGLAAHYCDSVWGAARSEFKRETGAHYLTLFGTTEDSGHIIFHDAWITPANLGASNQGLVMDVMTPHHSEYYMAEPNDNEKAPTDFDDPNPVAFLSVTGEFRFAVSCDADSEEGKKWANLAMTLLTEVLMSWGVGAKTSSGYGRFSG